MGVGGTPVGSAKRDSLSSGSLEIVHSFKLVVNRDELALDVVGVGETVKGVQSPFQARFCFD